MNAKEEFNALVRSFGTSSTALDVLLAETALETTIAPGVDVVSTDTSTGDLTCPLRDKIRACSSETFHTRKQLREHLRANHAGYLEVGRVTVLSCARESLHVFVPCGCRE